MQRIPLLKVCKTFHTVNNISLPVLCNVFSIFLSLTLEVCWVLLGGFQGMIESFALSSFVYQLVFQDKSFFFSHLVAPFHLFFIGLNLLYTSGVG